MVRIWLAVLVVVAANMLFAPSGLAGEKKPGETKDDGFIKVKAMGTLTTGVVAIGGETTGTVLKTKFGTLELDFGKDKKLRALAAKLSKKKAYVEGRLRIEMGMAVRLRIIVGVTVLKAASD